MDISKFSDNLKLTQNYCALQLSNTEKNFASVLRSFNPIYNSKPLFTFELSDLQLDIADFFLVKWQIDPTEHPNIINELLENQLSFKHKNVNKIGSDIKGRILMTEIDSTIPDGVSEVESEGFIDFFDLPPIDTWFYLGESLEFEGRRLLYSWVPEKHVPYCDKGIKVNSLDIINWK